MMKKNGTTRWVLFIFGYAFKFPCPISWRNVCWGMLANMQEKEFSRMQCLKTKLCPVVFSLPLGLLVVMPRVKTLTDEEFCERDREFYVQWCITEEAHVPAEIKADSFGWYRGRLVAVDYG